MKKWKKRKKRKNSLDRKKFKKHVMGFKTECSDSSDNCTKQNDCLGFDYPEYSDSSGPSRADIIEETLGWKENNPVEITTWLETNESKIHPRSVEFVRKKVYFVRDILGKLLGSVQGLTSDRPIIMIINSVYTIPVFDIYLKKYDVDVLLYSSSEDWDISVKSSKPLDFDFMGVFNPKKRANPFVFHHDRNYDSYEPSIRKFVSVLSSENESTSVKMNSTKFTANLRSDYDLYTFFFLLKNYLDKENEK